MSSWTDAGSLAELEREQVLVVRVGGRELGVLRDEDGQLYAVRNRCPHHGAPLCRGRIREREVGAPGLYEPSGKRVLRCPWHGWEFDLETGRCLDDARLRTRLYPVKVVDGRVLVAASAG
ncbi:MAG: Rieske (2Fe-2S) protein [Actinomycetota bacterium]|nr:Rieske (2Fe-2S) protein [Actinomycetota bacterium]